MIIRAVTLRAAASSLNLTQRGALQGFFEVGLYEVCSKYVSRSAPLSKNSSEYLHEGGLCVAADGYSGTTQFSYDLGWTVRCVEKMYFASTKPQHRQTQQQKRLFVVLPEASCFGFGKKKVVT